MLQQTVMAAEANNMNFHQSVSVLNSLMVKQCLRSYFKQSTMKCVREMGINNHKKQNEGCEEDMELTQCHAVFQRMF